MPLSFEKEMSWIFKLLLFNFVTYLYGSFLNLAQDSFPSSTYQTANLNALISSGSYEFGYEVGPDGQFHHENRGPDGVVYGCYGYVDPTGTARSTYYVSDGWGYRVVKRG